MDSGRIVSEKTEKGRVIRERENGRLFSYSSPGLGGVRWPWCRCEEAVNQRLAR